MRFVSLKQETGFNAADSNLSEGRGSGQSDIVAIFEPNRFIQEQILNNIQQLVEGTQYAMIHKTVITKTKLCKTCRELGKQEEKLPRARTKQLGKHSCGYLRKEMALRT